MRAKRGLRIHYCENVAAYDMGKGLSSRVRSTVADGWFIQVRRCGRWYSLMDLRFVREKDALRAAWALTAAGLDSHGAIMRADPLAVKQVACEHLQW